MFAGRPQPETSPVPWRRSTVANRGHHIEWNAVFDLAVFAIIDFSNRVRTFRGSLRVLTSCNRVSKRE